MKITNEIISYQQVENGYVLEKDDFGIGAYTLTDSIKKTFLENPNLCDKSKCMIFFSRVDGIIGGRQMFFPTKLKIANQCLDVQSGSSLQTVPEYRNYAIGMDMINYPIKSKDYPIILYAGINKMAIPIYKALKFKLYEIPEYWQARSSKFIFQYLGVRGVLLKLLSFMGNICIKSLMCFVISFVSIKNKHFEVNKLDVIPEWVDYIIENDVHKYAEIHDRKWMQWTLDNNFFAKPKDKQGFYEVRKGGSPLGFFMTKERDVAIPDRNIDSVVFGSVYEWGSFNEKQLSEQQIIQLAVTTFSKDVDIVQVSTLDSKVKRFLKRVLSIRHGNSTFILKDLTKSYKDIDDINNWRVRSGMCDCAFY